VRAIAANADRPMERWSILLLIMTSNAKTVEEYLAALPEDRREAIGQLRAVILQSLPQGYEETMQYGHIAYVVPHKLYPAGYHCNPADPLPYASLASQKSHMALYLMTVYGQPALAEWLREQYAARGLKLDMGKSCIRFKKLQQVPLDVIGEIIAKVPVEAYIAACEAALPAARRQKASARE
jgi:uncharacterized protein YdhG (YjbR/CyaY superfamily)